MRVLGSVLQLGALAVFAVTCGLVDVRYGLAVGSVGTFAVGFQLERLSTPAGEG